MADLADRIEAATADQQREMLELAWEAIHGSKPRTNRGGHNPENLFVGKLNVGAFVDAALSLVPEGWWLQYLGDLIGGAACRLETNGPPSQSIGAGLSGKPPVATRALAVCLAAIRARTLKEGTRK